MLRGPLETHCRRARKNAANISKYDVGTLQPRCAYLQVRSEYLQKRCRSVETLYDHQIKKGKLQNNLTSLGNFAATHQSRCGYFSQSKGIEGVNLCLVDISVRMAMMGPSSIFWWNNGPSGFTKSKYAAPIIKSTMRTRKPDQW